MHTRSRDAFLFICGFVLCVVGCTQAPQERVTSVPTTLTPLVTIYTTSTLTPYSVTAPVAPSTLLEWQSIQPGIEFLQRREHVGDVDDWVTLVRIDLTDASLRVQYAPDAPRLVREWYNDAQADVVINGGFFTSENKVAGLLVSDGQTFGQTYKGFGGMFSIREGRPQLQWLARQPYVRDRRVTQALQSFPFLVLDGQVIDALPDDGSRNRRSFLGIDQSGRVVLGVCHSPAWTMSDLANYLATSEWLNIDSALNLDGGASTGLWLRGVSEAHLIDSLEAVPAVITIQ